MTSEKMAWLTGRLKEYFTSFPRSGVGMQTDAKPAYVYFAAPESLVSDLTNDCRVLVPYACPRGSVGTREKIFYSGLEIHND
jgi:hypothetical protein